MKILKIFACTMSILLLVSISAPAKQNKQKQLPPGLQKKVERGGELPPGWQKKLRKGEILDQEVYDRGTVVKPADKNGIITIKIEDRVIRLIEATREIVSILAK